MLDLCAGIGGISLGLERAGFTIAGQVERDPFCLAVLRRHWPDVARHDDVTTFTGFGWRPDVLAAGFPCQPVSLAGARRAQDDERWLWPDIARPPSIVGSVTDAAAREARRRAESRPEWERLGALERDIEERLGGARLLTDAVLAMVREATGIAREAIVAAEAGWLEVEAQDRAA